MSTPDFFRSRIDSMIDLKHPLAVLARRLPWGQIEAALAPKFAREDRAGVVVQGVDMLVPTQALVGAGRSNAGRQKLPMRLLISLVYKQTRREKPLGRAMEFDFLFWKSDLKRCYRT